MVPKKVLMFYLILLFNILLITIYLLVTETTTLPQNYAKFNDKLSKKFSIVSISANGSSYYTFHLPITALFWRHIGYEPIVLYVTSAQAMPNDFDKKAIEYLNKMQVKIVYIKTESNYELLTTTVVRIFVGILPAHVVGENDFILTSDVDLYPVKSSYYNIINKVTIDQVNVWNAYCCGLFKHHEKTYQLYPMGHIGMKKSLWRKVMQLSDVNVLTGRFVLDAVDNYFGVNTVKQNEQIARGDATWDLDQKFISIRIKLSNESVNEIKHEPVRMDRSQNNSMWKSYLKRPRKITDVHYYQDQRILMSWHLLRDLFERVFQSNQLDMLDRYFAEFFTIKLN